MGSPGLWFGSCRVDPARLATHFPFGGPGIRVMHARWVRVGRTARLARSAHLAPLLRGRGSSGLLLSLQCLILCNLATSTAIRRGLPSARCSERGRSAALAVFRSTTLHDLQGLDQTERADSER